MRSIARAAIVALSLVVVLGCSTPFYALATPLTREPIGIGLPADDPLLVNWTQNWLREMEASGNLELIRDRWFRDASWVGLLP